MSLNAQHALFSFVVFVSFSNFCVDNDQALPIIERNALARGKWTEDIPVMAH